MNSRRDDEKLFLAVGSGIGRILLSGSERFAKRYQPFFLSSRSMIFIDSSREDESEERERNRVVREEVLQRVTIKSYEKKCLRRSLIKCRITDNWLGKGNTNRDLFAENGDNNERMRDEDKIREKKYIYIYMYIRKRSRKDMYTAHVAVSSEPIRNKQNESFSRLCTNYNPISLYRAGNIL